MKKIIFTIIYVVVILAIIKSVTTQLEDKRTHFDSSIKQHYYHFLDLYELFVRLNISNDMPLSDFHILIKGTQDADYDFGFILDRKDIIQSSRRDQTNLQIADLWDDIQPLLDSPMDYLTHSIRRGDKWYIVGIKRVDIDDAIIHLCILSDQTAIDLTWKSWSILSFFIYFVLWTLICATIIYYIGRFTNDMGSTQYGNTEEFLKKILADNDAFTIMVDVNQNVEFISQRLLNVLGYNESDVIGQPSSNFIMTIDIQEDEISVPKEYTDIQFEVHLLDVKGYNRSFLMTIFQQFDNKMNLERTLLIFQMIESYKEIEENLRFQTAKNQFLTNLTRMNNSSEDIEKILEFIVSEARKIVDFDFFTLYVVEDTRLHMRFSTDPEFKVRGNNIGKNLGDGLTGMVAKIRTSMTINDTRSSSIPQKVEGTSDDDECCISTPIQNDKKIFAVTLVSRMSLNYFTEADQNTIEELFNLLVVKFEKIDLQKKIDKANKRYDSIINESVLGVLILAENKIIFSNRKMLEFLDYGEKYLLNRDIFSLIEDSNKSMFMAQLTSFQLNSGLSTFEITLKNVENKEIIFEMNLSSIEWKEQNCILIIANNITKRVELNNHLLQAQKLESLGALTSGIAHDFKNILAGIMGAADLLMLKSDETSQTYNYAKVIKSSASRGASLSHQLLNFSSTRKLKEEIFNLNDVLQETIQIITYTFNKNILLQYDFSKDLLFFEGDVVKIQQCILNLCVNARDAMPDGGTLTIRTKMVRDVEEIKNLWPEAENRAYSYIEISDTGSGIPDAILPSIFDAFFTTKEKNKGTGLGLATTRSIMLEYKGFITLTSKVGVGTSFYIFLPWIENVLSVAETTTTSKKTKVHNILLVDDEPVILDVATELLEEIGCTVHATDDGYKALEMIEQFPDIDLAIIDRIMPKMDGFTLLKKIKELKPEVVVVFASGFVQESDQVEFKNHGALTFIQKPYKLEDLIALLNKI